MSRQESLPDLTLFQQESRCVVLLFGLYLLARVCPEITFILVVLTSDCPQP